MINTEYDSNDFQKPSEIKRKALNEKRQNALLTSLANETWFDFNKSIQAEDKCNAFFNTFMKHVDAALPITKT